MFIDHRKINDATRAHLGPVIIHEYHEIELFLMEHSKYGKISVDANQLNYRLFNVIKQSNPLNLIERISPITMLKSVKNEVELNGIRACHVRDGVALTAFLAWMHSAMRNATNSTSLLEDGKFPENWEFTELSVSDKLETFRESMDLHVSKSFSTIAGYGPHGMVQYSINHPSYITYVYPSDLWNTLIISTF